ncbi:23S rRNA (uracil(1939)-C(5))-methyltransferase RlmD [[Clostridium] hylemonae]|uniref:23S rRNA (uracil(1939)-C(5))-methyltransferase RlmD n=2 Tax=[Clostridium] hylemonae TaxID=89153 RepID=UPI001D086E3A|nr:23S rRNA (uracil(1939)-C(5))-methyltransferase RlmD [[Clostridium] hylemonae]MCB7521975.1 23S rRNA (uracil(1939)-C(5))-methyltransferase RlmD [[Clostridium] hylemonae]
MKKNDMVKVTIEDIGVNGEGIGKVDGYTLFIKDAVIGDVVEAKVTKAKKNYGYARLVNIADESEFRVTPRCDVARQCGGCQIQAMSYARQLEYKNEKVRNNLIRLGGVPQELLDEVMEPVCGMEEPYRYRNKAQFPVGTDREGNIITGFYAGRTHQIIPHMDCAIGRAENKEILNIIISFMKEFGLSPYDETSHKGLVRHILIRTGYRSGEIMVCLVINGNGVPHGDILAERLAEIPGMTSVTYSVNREKTNVIMGREAGLLWGQAYITDYIGDIKYQISPLSFYQVNPVQTERLYETALEYAGLHGDETVWDLYCGIGTISLFLAQKAKHVYGVEIVPQAIEDAKKNAQINGIENARFYVGKAEDVLPEKYENDGIQADIIVVDPPRKGCEESVLHTMVKMQPERIVYVSCDSATLARDVKYLRGSGYEVKRVKAVDMFPHTGHVETVVMLSHKKPDSVINVKVELGGGEGKVSLDYIAKRAETYKSKEQVIYKMIKEYIEAKYGFKVHTAYIAEVKRDLSMPMYDAHYAAEELKHLRKHPTAEKVEAIKDALKYFDIVK